MRYNRHSSSYERPCVSAQYRTQSFRNAFTIIELLVVIGIISILAIALLVTLNPAQGQRQARDTQRLKDASTLQTILAQYYQDPSNPLICADAPCVSTGGTGTANSQPCDASNWLGVDLV